MWLTGFSIISLHGNETIFLNNNKKRSVSSSIGHRNIQKVKQDCISIQDGTQNVSIWHLHLVRLKSAVSELNDLLFQKSPDHTQPMSIRALCFAFTN